MKSSHEEAYFCRMFSFTDTCRALPKYQPYKLAAVLKMLGVCWLQGGCKKTAQRIKCKILHWIQHPVCGLSGSFFSLILSCWMSCCTFSLALTRAWYFRRGYNQWNLVERKNGNELKSAASTPLVIYISVAGFPCPYRWLDISVSGHRNKEIPWRGCVPLWGSLAFV